MANNQIRMTPDTMRSRATEYRTEAGKVDEVIRKMDNLLKQLQSEWEGAASDSYATRFADLRPGFVDAHRLIGEIADALTKTADIVQDTDDKIANQFRA